MGTLRYILGKDSASNTLLFNKKKNSIVSVYVFIPESQNNLWELVLFLYHVGPEVQTQSSGMLLFPLNHLVGSTLLLLDRMYHRVQRAWQQLNYWPPLL